VKAIQSIPLRPSHALGAFELPLRAQVSQLTRTGLNWSIALLVARYTISVASTAVLARLLSPGDYGLMAMVATITVLAQAISDCGLSWATVQQERLERNQIDVLFLVNCAFGLFLTVLCVLSAPYVAHFYRRPELTRIIFAAGATLFLSSVAVQPNALLLRKMKLKQMNLSALFSLSISAVVTILMARAGFGYWALVAQLILQQALTTAIAFPLSGYLPGWPRHLLNLGGLLKFGGYSAAYGLVNYFARNFDNVLVGRYWGATALGFYSRAYFLMTLPGMLVIGAFSGVLIPALSALRKEPTQMQSEYLRALRVISILGCSMAVGLIVTAPELVEFVYGSKWHAVVPILLWLSAASILQPIQNTAQWLFIVAGRGRGMLAMGLLVTGSATLAFLIGIRSGPVGVARAYAISNTIIAYPVLAMGHRACGLSMRRTIAQTFPLLLCALIMGTLVYFAGEVCSAVGIGLHARLLTKVLFGIAIYIVSLRALARSTYSEVLRNIGL
jgi:O-antigen/teichoic acid export membrane protein